MKKQSPKAGAGATKRKMDDTIDLDSKEVRLFECPLCLEILRGRIYQCGRGHLICGTCDKKYSKCPTCQLSLSKKIRNIAMEELALKIPLECPNGLMGCKAMCKAAEIRAHLDNECAFEKKNLCGMIGIKCKEVVKLIDWTKHLEEHRIETIQGSEALIKQSLPPLLQGSTDSIPTLKFKPVCLMAFDAAFVFETQMDATKNMLIWRVRSIGLQRPGDYYYKLKLLGSQPLVNGKKYPIGIHKGIIVDASYEDSEKMVPTLSCAIRTFFKLTPSPENSVVWYDVEVKVKKWNDRVKSDAFTPPVVRNIPSTHVAVVKLNRTAGANGNGNNMGTPTVSRSTRATPIRKASASGRR